MFILLVVISVCVWLLLLVRLVVFSSLLSLMYLLWSFKVIFCMCGILVGVCGVVFGLD